MPCFEIVAHVGNDLECNTPEEAVAASGAGCSPGPTPRWRSATSPLPASLRGQRGAFFAGIERRAAGAEDAFRARVVAIRAGAVPDGAQPVPPTAPVAPLVEDALDGGDRSVGLNPAVSSPARNASGFVVFGPEQGDVNVKTLTPDDLAQALGRAKVDLRRTTGYLPGGRHRGT